MALRGQNIFRKGTSSTKILDLTLKTYERRVVNDSSSSGAYKGISGYSADENTQTESGEELHERSLPEEPTNCCMSGCANCVWIKYAEELVNSCEGGSDMARQVILNKVQDPNMKAFLSMELRTMGK